MTWYYSDGDKQLGPISEAELVALRGSETVTDDTLVWREGMANWARYPEAGLAVGELPPLIPVPPVAQPAASEAVCVECGKIFSKDEMITHGQSHVCVGCKPVFMQKLAEGARIGIPGRTAAFRYAGFWIRFAAKFIDNLLVEVVAMAVGFILGLAAAGVSPQVFVGVQLLIIMIGLGLRAGYTIIMIGKYGATLGKMACKLKVVNADGSHVSYGKATGRFFAEILSGCPTLLIGYIIAGSDEERRALHDRICGTRVVFKD